MIELGIPFRAFTLYWAWTVI